MYEPNQVSAIIEAIFTRVKQGNDAPEVEKIMLEARRDIKQWQSAGQVGEIPHREALISWGILKTPDDQGETAPSGASSFATTSEDPALYDAVVGELTPTNTDVASDPDELLQAEFDRAEELYKQKHYRLARDAFAALEPRARGRLIVPIGDRRLAAKQAWELEVGHLIQTAQTYNDANRDDLDGVRERWLAVLRADEQNDTAQRALEKLRSRRTREQTVRDIDSVRVAAERAFQRDNLPDINTAFGDAEQLRTNNVHDDLIPACDDLVQLVAGLRAQLRDKLGAASTVLANNQVEAYRLAREYFNKGVRIMVDTSGVMGSANAEVETEPFFRRVRVMAIESLRQIANQRIAEARGQQDENPLQARKTLLDAVKRLTDPVLTSEDQEQLKESLERVQGPLVEVEDRINRFNQAQAKILAAQETGLNPREQLRLYQEARSLYDTYPHIASYIESATDAVASVLTTELEEQMTVARLRIAADAFEDARQILRDVRHMARVTIPQPRPNSLLEQRLDEIRDVEEEAVRAQTRYESLLKQLSEVNTLLDEHEQDKASGKLNTARILLEQLGGTSNYEANHPETRRVWARLIAMQGSSESWTQGQDAYRRGDWDKAISQLRQVVDSDLPEKDHATKLFVRSQAAQAVQDGQRAQEEHRIREALSKYRLAEGEFRKVGGADEFTEHLFYVMQQAQGYLKSFEANDAKVQESLNRAQSLLRQADIQVTQRRNELSTRVEPVENFAKAMEILDGIKNLESTLTEELEKLRREAREKWRKAYVETMEFTSKNSDDISILQKAYELGQTLYNHGLLIDARDKMTWRVLQEKRLDLQYNRLLQRTPPVLTELQEIERNRKERLDLAPIHTDELRRDYRDAIARRVIYQIGEQQDAEKAFSLLQQELQNNPTLYQNEALFTELMHLCWQRGDWGAALYQTELLPHRSQLEDAHSLSNIWRTLTMAAKELWRGESKKFQSDLERLKTRSDMKSELIRQLIEPQQRWLVEKRVEVLRRLASDVLTENKDVRVIDAAHLYAQANLLDPLNQQVRQELQQINERLVPNLKAQCQLAKQIRLRERSLEQALRETRQLRNMLGSIESVKHVLNMESELDQDLTRALAHLDARIGAWSSIEEQFRLINAELKQARTEPTPMRVDGSGGWDLEDVVKSITELWQQVHRQGDNDLTPILLKRRDEAEDLLSKAQKLNRAIYEFRKNLAQEEFETASNQSIELETLWREAKLDGFDGLEQLIRYDYPQAGESVRRLVDHRAVNRRQQANLVEWQNWADKTKKLYEQASSAASKILKKDKGLSDLQADRSLAEIGELCQSVVTACEDFRDQLEQVPRVGPLSRKAVEAQAVVSQAWRTEMLDEQAGYLARVNRLWGEVENKQRELEQGPLRKLRRAMNNLEEAANRIGQRRGLLDWRTIDVIPDEVVKVAERLLKECQVLDSYDSQVVKYGKRLQELRQDPSQRY